MKSVGIISRRAKNIVRNPARNIYDYLSCRYPDKKSIYDLYALINGRSKPLFNTSEDLSGSPGKIGKVMCYHLTQRGFYSELNNMINAYMYCLDAGVAFVLKSNDFLYKYRLGWCDYFEPFWDEKWESEGILKYEMKYAHDWNLWFRIRGYDYNSIAVPELGLHKGKAFENKSLIAKRICRYIPDVKITIEEALKILDMPEKYVSLHIRRGDKVGERPGIPEAKRIDARDYIEKALEINPNTRDIFVSSDSYESIREIKSYISRVGLDIRLYSTCSPSHTGHSTDELIKKFEDKYENVLRLLIDVEACVRSDYFIGTYSSNMSRFIALMHSNPDNCISMDVEWTLF